MAHSSDASSTVEAPSVSGVELPAVMVAASPLPKTGLSLASFSTVESGRRLLSRSRPRNGVIWSSRKPASYAAARCWCDGAASSSCSSRPICHSSAVSAAWSPIDRPVRGSPFCGMDEADVAGPDRGERGQPARVSWAELTLSSFLRSFSPIATGASEVVSVPPAMPTSIWPRAILFATWIAACRPVPQACWMSVAGVSGDELRAEHRLAGQVEVAGVLEHRAGDDLAQPLALRARTGRPGRRWPRSACPGWTRWRRRCWSGRTGCGCRRGRRRDGSSRR